MLRLTRKEPRDCGPQEGAARRQGAARVACNDRLDRLGRALRRKQRHGHENGGVIALAVSTARGKEREGGGDPRLVSERRQHGKETRQLRPLVVCYAVAGLLVLVVVAAIVPIPFRPGIEHMSGELMRLDPKRRILLRAFVNPFRCQRLEERQSRCRAGLIDHREPPLPCPEHQRRVTTGPLQPGASFTRALTETLLVPPPP